MTCQVTIILFITHIFYKEIEKHAAGAKNIQVLRHAMALAQEAEIKVTKYDGLNDDAPSIMQVTAIPYSEVMAIQGPDDQPSNAQDNNQVQDMKASR